MSEWKDAWKNVDDMFKRIDERHAHMNEEFKRLLCEPSSKAAAVGDRVVVAVGFIGRGHLWERMEGAVLEVGDTSAKVLLDRKRYDDSDDIVWVHPALITDVLGPATSTARSGGEE